VGTLVSNVARPLWSLTNALSVAPTHQLRIARLLLHHLQRMILTLPPAPLWSMKKSQLLPLHWSKKKEFASEHKTKQKKNKNKNTNLQKNIQKKNVPNLIHHYIITLICLLVLHF
jgi:hypothetical protein